MSKDTNPVPPRHRPAIGTLLGSLKLGDPSIDKGLGLWPVLAEPCPEPAYLTFVEAQSLPGFRITEVSEGGSVPSLRVVNETVHHVLLFDGEELRGAKQNRILNTTILVAAGCQLDVPVSCTESGRWSYQSPEFSASGSVAYHELRKRKAEAVRENLQACMGPASDQGAVWDEIEQLHAAGGTADKSRTRAMLDAYEERRREIEDFSREVPCADGQCGLLAVLGDRVEGVDVLSRPEAYARLHRRLVESHAMDFLVRKKGKSHKSADPQAPARFLAEVALAEESVHKSPGLGNDHRLTFRWGHGSALRVDETIVHLALFNSRNHGHPSEPPLRRRHHG